MFDVDYHFNSARFPRTMPQPLDFKEKSSPRLIDYVVFVGKRNPSRSGRAIYHPELLRVYPPQNHADYALPNDIVYFCQPEGCYSTSSQSFILDPQHSSERLSQNIKMKSFTFMLTDKESNTVRFGVCLNFLRPIGRRKSSYTANVTRRRITSFKSALTRMVSKQSPTRIRSCETPVDSSSSSDSSYIMGSQAADRPDRPYTHTLTSICLVSRHPFLKKFERCLQFLYILIQKLHEGCKPRLSGRQTVWSVLTGSFESPELLTVKKSVEEIDTWILRLLSTPAPVAGKTAVHVYLHPSEFGQPIVYALPDKNRFSLVDYSLCLPLRLLGVEKFLKVLFALLLEQKVVMESSHHDELTTCVLAFTALCYPLQYLFTVIPLLPSSLKGAEQILHAPSPYIIGLPRSFRNSRPSFHLPKDALLVDLDTQEFYGQSAHEPVPKLPQSEEKVLHSQLHRVLASLNGTREELTDRREDKSSSGSRSPNVELRSFEQLALDADEESLNLAIRVAMVLFFKSPNVLGGFNEHTRTVRIYPRPVVAFQYERFMKSRPEPSPFTVVLAKTQAVEYFAEWSLTPDNIAYQSVNGDDLRPADYGDREKWFSDTLTPITFKLWTERFDQGLLRPVVELLFSTASPPNLNDSRSFPPEWSSSKQLTFRISPPATRSSTSGACGIEISSDSDTPTDVSASNGDSHVNTDTERFSDEESGEDGTDQQLPSNEKGCTVKDNVTLSSLVLDTPDKVECMQFGKELPSNLRTYYAPPTTFVIPDIQPQPNVPSALSSPQDLSSSRQIFEEIIQRLTPSDSATSSGFPSRKVDFPVDSGLSTNQVSKVNSPNSPRKPSIYSNRSSQPRSGRSTLSAIIDSWFLDAAKPVEDNAYPEIRKNRMELELSEIERFINDCVASVRKGNQPGIFSRQRLKKLMEEEIYRNLTLALTNGNVGHPVSEGQSHISDVYLDSWEQYKAYVWLFTQLGVGIRQSYRPLLSTFMDSRGDIVSAVGLAAAFRDLFTSQADRQRAARGGICSTFSLLEMAHTHHYLLPKRRSNTSSTFVPNTPLRSGNVTPALATSVPTSPKQSISPKVETPTNCNSYTSDKNFLLPFSITRFDSKYRNQGFRQAIQFSFKYLRDIPDSAELSQRLQARIAEAFRNSSTNQTSQAISSEIASQRQQHHGAYLTREAALRLSQRLSFDNNQTPPSMLHQKHTRSQIYRTRPLQHSSRSFDDDSRKSIGSTRLSSMQRRPITDLETAFNVINTQKPAESQLLSIDKRKPIADEEGAHSTTSNGISMDMVEDVVLLPPFKSAVSLGYRYRHGRLFQTASRVSPTVETTPPCISVPALRISLAQQRLTSQTKKTNTNFAPDDQLERSDDEIQEIKPEQLRSKIDHTYLFEEAMVNSMDSKLWTNMQFWEDLFLDTVAQQRDLLGMDFDPAGLLEHYSQVGTISKKLLELGEDALLADVMHNLIAFMVMSRIPPDLIRRKICRLIAKSHTGLHYTQKITQLLDCLEWLKGNDIDLVPIASRQFVPETFTLSWTWEGGVETLIMGIYSDFLLIRSTEGNVLCRWWFDQIINVLLQPHQNVVVFQIRMHKKHDQFLFTADDPDALFKSIVTSLNRARSKSEKRQIIEKLGGRVNVINADTEERGVIDLNINGFHLTFGENSLLIPLDQVKSCKITAEDIFSFEVVGRGLGGPIWNFKTDMALILLNQWERLLGVAMVRSSMNVQSGVATPMSSRSRTPSSNNMGTVLEQ